MKHKRKPMSATVYVLLAFVPYTKPNLALSFHPNTFFNELERISNCSAKSLRTAYARAKQKGLISVDSSKISLSLDARHTVAPFVAQSLKNGGKLMVIYDIPEHLSTVRQRFMRVLKKLSFAHVQQSVLISDKDYQEIVKETIEIMELQDYVQLYESVRIKI